MSLPGAIFQMFSCIFVVSSWIAPPMLTNPPPPSFHLLDAGFGVKPTVYCKKLPSLEVSGL
ncbi:hypothetical protein EXN66_Car012835 [Channa argus]|uniref:Uncharacterized protein n=1 Tax=Channa argus TaxID=215402 RepID=A0A6G1Q3P7_CHAAH|nr:hypothetical protein EXN66_Car012835 [Channa argus]